MRKQQYKVTKARRMLAGLILAGSFVGATVAYASVGKSGTLYYQNNKNSVRVCGYVDLVDMPAPFPDKVYYNASIGGPYWEATSGKYTVKTEKNSKKKLVAEGRLKIGNQSVSLSKDCGYGNSKAFIKLYLAADGRTKTITDKDTR